MKYKRINNKISFFISILFILFLTLTSASAYSYSTSSSSQDYLSDKLYQKLPVYLNSPKVNDKSSSFNKASSSFNRYFQGPIIERTIKYDETFYQKRSKIQKTISASLTEKYAGAIQIENANTNEQNSYNKEFNSLPNNPSYYDGGSFFRNLEKYESSSFGKDRYDSQYYYTPRLSKEGYYNWRY